MKRQLAEISLAIAAALVFISSPVGATVTITTDGVWWQALSRDQKITAMQGLQAGLTTGYFSGFLDAEIQVSLGLKLPVATVNKKIETNYQPVFSKSFGTYIDELDVWYEVHPKRTGIEPAQLLGDCFADKPAYGPQDCEKLGSEADK
jgi:hypothetical protein